MVSFAPEYRICNLAEEGAKITGEEQVIVTTIGKILNYLKNPRLKLDLSTLRMFVLDEADNFFMDERRENEIMQFHQALQKLSQPVQYVFFSATFDKAITDKLSELITEANQINLKLDQLKLDNVS